MSGSDANDRLVYAQVAKRSARPGACWPAARQEFCRTCLHEQAATRIVDGPKTACTGSAHLASSSSSSFQPIVDAKAILLFMPLERRRHCPRHSASSADRAKHPKPVDGDWGDVMASGPRRLKLWPERHDQQYTKAANPVRKQWFAAKECDASEPV
jgi:hypothetical protein